MLQLPPGVQTGRPSDDGESGGVDACWLQPGTLAQIPATGRLWPPWTNWTVSGQVGSWHSMQCCQNFNNSSFLHI